MLLSRVVLAGSRKCRYEPAYTVCKAFFSHAGMSAVLEVTKSLPQRGLGSKLQRIKWQADSYWTVTAVKPSIVRLEAFCLRVA